MDTQPRRKSAAPGTQSGVQIPRGKAGQAVKSDLNQHVTVLAEELGILGATMNAALQELRRFTEKQVPTETASLQLKELQSRMAEMENSLLGTKPPVIIPQSGEGRNSMGRQSFQTANPMSEGLHPDPDAVAQLGRRVILVEDHWAPPLPSCKHSSARKPCKRH